MKKKSYGFLLRMIIAAILVSLFACMPAYADNVVTNELDDLTIGQNGLYSLSGKCDINDAANALKTAFGDSKVISLGKNANVSFVFNLPNKIKDFTLKSFARAKKGADADISFECSADNITYTALTVTPEISKDYTDVSGVWVRTYDYKYSFDESVNYVRITLTYPQEQSSYSTYPMLRSIALTPDTSASGSFTRSEVTLKNGKPTVTLNNTTSQTKECMFIAAIYDADNSLSGYYPKEVSNIQSNSKVEASIDDFSNPDNKTVRYIIVENLDNMKPISKSSQIEVDTNYYPGFVRKAVTMSFDDGPILSSDNTVMKKLSASNYKATFNLITNTFLDENGNNYSQGTKYTVYNTTGYIDGQNSEAEYNANSDKIFKEFMENINSGNHEIASHSRYHLRFNTENNPSAAGLYNSAADIKASLLAGKDSLEKWLGKEVRGFAYPYSYPGTNGKQFVDYLSEIGTCYARHSGYNGKFDIPFDFMNWTFTSYFAGVSADELAQKSSDFWNMADDGNLKLFSLWGHSWEFNAKENVREDTWSKLDDIISDMDSHKNEFWNPTNIEFYDYIKARESIEVNDDSVYNPSNTDVYVTVNGIQKVVPAKGTITA